MREGFDRSAYLENTLKGIGALEEYAERYQRNRRICLYPFYALEEYAHILSAYLENMHTSFLGIFIFPNTRIEYKCILHMRRKDISVFFLYVERIYAYSSNTQKRYKRILKIRRYTCRDFDSRSAVTSQKLVVISCTPK